MTRFFSKWSEVGAFQHRSASPTVQCQRQRWVDGVCQRITRPQQRQDTYRRRAEGRARSTDGGCGDWRLAAAKNPDDSVERLWHSLSEWQQQLAGDGSPCGVAGFRFSFPPTTRFTDSEPIGLTEVYQVWIVVSLRESFGGAVSNI